MYLSSIDIIESLRQGKDFIFISSAKIDSGSNRITSCASVPEGWVSRFVSPSLVVESMGQTIELLIRKVAGISNVLYLLKIKNLRFYNIIAWAEEFKKIEIVAKTSHNINNCYISIANAYIDNQCLCSAEIYHYIKKSTT